MKTMIIVETDYERAQLRKCWDALMKAKADGVEDPRGENFISCATNMDVNGDIDLFHPKENENLYAIVYDLQPDGWHIYNFNTMEEEVVEGDLAGLANSDEGNFPFFG